MKYLVIDTNVFGRDPRLRSASWQTILRASRELGFEVVVPGVVFDEALELFRRRYRDQERLYLKALGALEASLGAELARPDVPEVEPATSSYESYLKSLFRRYGIKVLDYPSVSHREIVVRAGRRKAPMADSDKGYKDYLVWRTIVELAVNEEVPLVFLTFNTRDFMDGGQLKADLKNDLVDAGVPAVLQVYSSLPHFMACEIEPNLASHDEFKRDLSEGRIRWFVPVEAASADVEGRIGDSFPGDEFDLRAESVSVTAVGEPEDVVVESVVRVDERFVKVDLSYSVPIEVEGEFIIDDPGYRIAPGFIESGQGYASYETELILDLENEEVVYDYCLQAAEQA